MTIIDVPQRCHMWTWAEADLGGGASLETPHPPIPSAGSKVLIAAPKKPSGLGHYLGGQTPRRAWGQCSGGLMQQQHQGPQGLSWWGVLGAGQWDSPLLYVLGAALETRLWSWEAVSDSLRWSVTLRSPLSSSWSTCLTAPRGRTAT